MWEWVILKSPSISQIIYMGEEAISDVYKHKLERKGVRDLAGS